MSLLRLPAEVRDLIWECLFAREYIHITDKREEGFKHYLCSVGITDFSLHDRYYEMSDSPPTPIPTRNLLPPGQSWTAEEAEAKPFDPQQNRKWTVLPVRRRYNPDDGYYTHHHKACRYLDMTQTSASQQAFVQKRTQLQLSPMRTSKLFCAEIFATIWTCNTFAFDTEDHFSTSVQEFLPPISSRRLDNSEPHRS